MVSNLQKGLGLKGLRHCNPIAKSNMNLPWSNIKDPGAFIAFPDFIRNTRYPGSMGIQKLGLLGSSAGEKGLRDLWLCSPPFLRPENPQGSRSFLRRHAELPGCGNSSGFLPQVSYGFGGHNHCCHSFGRRFLDQAAQLTKNCISFNEEVLL